MYNSEIIRLITVTFFVLFFYFVWIVSLLGFGSPLLLFSKFERFDLKFIIPNEIKIAIFGIFGLVILATFGLIVNFFIPLGSIFSFLLILIGVCLFAINRKILLSWVTKTDALIIILLMIYWAIYPFLQCQNGDTTGYHITSIKWITESVIPFGLANLHGRLGFNSSWFIVAAILEPFRIITKYPYFILNAIIAFFYTSAIFLLIKNNIQNKSSFSSWFLIASVFTVFFKLGGNILFPHLENNISSPSPDVPVAIIILLVTYLLIYEFEKPQQSNIFLFLAVLFSIFLFTLKLSGAIYAIGSLLILAILYIREIIIPKRAVSPFHKKRSLSFIIFVLLISMIIMIPWMLKGVFLSGCIAYPLSIGFFKDLPWSIDSTELTLMMNDIKAWARNPGANYLQVLSPNGDWFIQWFKNFLFKEISFFLFVVIGGLLLLVSLLKKNKGDGKLAAFLVPAVLSFTGIMVWFVTAPDPRFGYGYLYSFALLFFSLGLLRSNKIPFIYGRFGRFVRKYVLFSIIISGLLLIFLGISLYMGIWEGFFVNLLTAIMQRKIDTNRWIENMRNIGVICTVIGIFILFSKLIFVRKIKFRILIVILLLLISFSCLTKYQDFFQLCKIIPKPIISYETDDGIVLYTSPEAIIARKGNINVVDVNNYCDMPLLFSPYYRGSLIIKLAKDGKPNMFIISKKHK